MKIFASKKSKPIIDKLVIVAGGGSEIDKAKIYAKMHNKQVIAIPTTGSGASETSHAVKWGKTKQNVLTEKPISIAPFIPIKLSKETRRNSIYDILGHIVDYLNVCNDNELIEVGRYAGSLIKKHPTNLTHPASYPLTLAGVPHGEAVGMVLLNCIRKAFYDTEGDCVRHTRFPARRRRGRKTGGGNLPTPRKVRL